MPISPNSNPNPLSVVANGVALDRVYARQGGAGPYETAWSKDSAAPASMSLVKVVSANMELWLRNLTLVGVRYVYYSSSGRTRRIAEYRASSCTFDISWTSLAFWGYLHPTSDVSRLQKIITESGATISGVDSRIDYEDVSISPDNKGSFDFRAADDGYDDGDTTIRSFPLCSVDGSVSFQYSTGGAISMVYNGESTSYQSSDDRWLYTATQGAIFGGAATVSFEKLL